MSTDQTTNQLTFRLSDRSKQRLNEIAFDLSEAGNRVNASDVVREAVQDYLDKYDENPEQCAPCERGRLGSEIEEGAA